MRVEFSPPMRFFEKPYQAVCCKLLAISKSSLDRFCVKAIRHRGERLLLDTERFQSGPRLRAKS